MSLIPGNFHPIDRVSQVSNLSNRESPEREGSVRNQARRLTPTKRNSEVVSRSLENLSPNFNLNQRFAMNSSDEEDFQVKRLKISPKKLSTPKKEDDGGSHHLKAKQLSKRAPLQAVDRPHLPALDDHIAALLRPVEISPRVGRQADSMPPPTPGRMKVQNKGLEGFRPMPNVLDVLKPSAEAFSPYAGYKSGSLCPPTPARNRGVGKRVEKIRRDGFESQLDSLKSSRSACPPTPSKKNKRIDSRLSPAIIERKGIEQKGKVRDWQPVTHRSASGSGESFQRGKPLGQGQHMTVHPVICEKPLFLGYSNDRLLAKFYKHEARKEEFMDNSLMQYHLSLKLNEALLNLATRDFNGMSKKDLEDYRQKIEPLVGYPIMKILNADTVKQDGFFIVENIPDPVNVEANCDAKTLAALPAMHPLAQLKRFLQISYDPLDYLASQIDQEFYSDFTENYWPYTQSKDYQGYMDKFYPQLGEHGDARAIFFEDLKNKFSPYLQIHESAFYENLTKLYPDAQKQNFRIREDGTVVLIDFMEHMPDMESTTSANLFGVDLLQNCLTSFTEDVEDKEAVYRYLKPKGYSCLV